MSKSLGNFFTIRDILKQSEWPEAITGEILRYFLLSTHYRSPLEFSDQSLREAKSALNGFYDLFERLKESTPAQGAADNQLQKEIVRLRQEFVEAMEDDLNTPAAVAALQKLRGEANRCLEAGVGEEARSAVRQEFCKLGDVLGLLQMPNWQFKSQVPQTPDGQGAEGHMTLSDEDIAAQIAARIEAKKAKDYGRADRIRAELASFGITIEDRPDGTSRWKR